jgi:hypothetical protein
MIRVMTARGGAMHVARNMRRGADHRITAAIGFHVQAERDDQGDDDDDGPAGALVPAG